MFYLPIIEKEIIDNALLLADLSALVPRLAIFAVVWIVLDFSAIPRHLVQTYLEQRVANDLRLRMFNHYQHLSLAFRRREHSGRTLTLFNSDVPILSGLLGSTLVSVTGSTTALLLGPILMLHLNAELAIAALVAPPLIGGFTWFVTRRLRPIIRAVQEKTTEANEQLQESMAGFREVLAFGGEKRQLGRLSSVLREILGLRMRAALYELAVGRAQVTTMLALNVVVFGYGGYLITRGEATLGGVIAMRLLFSLVAQPAREVVALVATAQRCAVSAGRVYRFLEERPQVVGSPGRYSPEPESARVEFKHVYFGYDVNQLTLRDVSLTAAPGRVTAIVGPSGAGKSTLVSLIPRFYDPEAGQILLNGTDLREFELAELRSLIGFVFQDTFLFSATVRDNIAIGRESASDCEIVQAATMANAMEFIDRLPQSLQTPVGERGVRLSEGQKQRIAIARALLRDPKILILDEPTSALDAHSEMLLQQALDSLMRGRTTFVIAHRLATVRRADQILVLNEGRIEEQGSHDELLRRRGTYFELCRLQFGEPGPLPV